MRNKIYTDEELILRRKQIVKRYKERNKQKIKQQEKKYKADVYEKNKLNIIFKNKQWAFQNKEIVKKHSKKKSKKYRDANRVKINTQNRIYKKDICKKLTDSYIKQVIQGKGLPNASKNLIDIQRNVLELKRELKNKTNAKSNSNLRTTE